MADDAPRVVTQHGQGVAGPAEPDDPTRLTGGPSEATPLVARTLPIEPSGDTRLRRATDAAVASDEVAIGEVLGHTYKIEELIAKGGMGVVYKARHTILESEHAVKVILPELAGDPQIVEMMKTEAKALRKVKNDAVVEYQGIFYDEKRRRYLVMEFVDGPSLASVLKDRRLAPEEVRVLRDRLALGLAAAHDKHVFHRDISPDNIILPDGKVDNAKLIDFGIAKNVEAGERPTTENFAGKYSYVSPEQAGLFGGRIDGRSDMYSLGLVLAAAAIGFGGKLEMGNSPINVLQARQTVPDLSRIPAELRDEIGRLLQPNPDARPASMREIVRPQSLATAGLGADSTPVLIEVDRSRKPLIALAALLGGAMVATAVHFAFPQVLLSLAGASTKAIAMDIRNALADLRCSTLQVEVTQDALFRSRARVIGVVPTTDDLKRIGVELANIRAISGFENLAKVVDWPFCDAINIAETMTDQRRLPKAAPLIVPAQPELVFRDDDALVLPITASPAFDGYLYVDLIDVDGTVLHMLPSPRRPENVVPAGAEITLGAPKPLPGQPRPADSIYLVSPPFGRLMLMATSSPRRLFSRSRPQSEPAGDYFEALRTALDETAQAGPRAIASYRFLETAPSVTERGSSRTGG